MEISSKRLSPYNLAQQQALRGAYRDNAALQGPGAELMPRLDDNV
jgi:hypothetical protein